jgi:hypothetical protein
VSQARAEYGSAPISSVIANLKNLISASCAALLTNSSHKVYFKSGLILPNDHSACAVLPLCWHNWIGMSAQDTPHIKVSAAFGTTHAIDCQDGLTERF